jgi:hypothetical protein
MKQEAVHCLNGRFVAHGALKQYSEVSGDVRKVSAASQQAVIVLSGSH